MIALGVLIVHACLLLALAGFRAKRGLTLGGAPWIVAIVVPVAGPLSVIALLAAERSGGAGSRSGRFEELRSDDAREEPVLGGDSEKKAVPLEDAMLLNDAATRRDLMMDVLLQGGEEYSASLVEARSSDDPEVAHYASSATMEISTNFDEALASWGLRYQQDPENPETLKRYLGVLERYLDSGIASGEVKRIEETRYREVLARKIQVDPEEVDLLRLAESQLGEGLLEDADMTIEKMEELYPDEDDTWFMRLRYWYELENCNEIERMIESKENAHPSERVRDEIDFWKKAAA